MHTLVPAAPLHLNAKLNYLVYEGKRPQVFMTRGPAAAVEAPFQQQLIEMPIRNARCEIIAPSLDTQGFELRKHRSAITDFFDDVQVRERYYSECAALLRQVTGAEEVVVFDHTRRNDAENPGNAAPPARGVHCDQTFVSGPRRVRDHLPPAEAERRLARRCAIINVWRPIAEPVQRAPLALCDARSIAPEDIVAADFIYPDKTGEVALFVPSERHRWFYYPQMTCDEVILIKIYDSLEDGTARLSAHTAFDDPTSPKTAAPRQSIELRALVFWA